MTDTEIEALSDPQTWADHFDDATRAALRLADAMCGETHSLEPQLVNELRANFTETDLAEIILVCGQANLNNRAGNAAKLLLG